MGIPVMNLLPFAAPPAKAAAQGAASAHDNSHKDNRFQGLLAALSAPVATTNKGARQDAGKPQTTGAPAKEQLEEILSALSGGKADLNAPGLGLTAEQQQELVSKLETLLQSSEDGAGLLAQLLAVGHLKTFQPDDLSKLVKLLSTSADGTVSLDALTSNLHLLTRAIHLMASSDGKMTMLQAVQELTSGGDAFAQQLAAAMAQTETPEAVSDDPIPIDTGPPEGGTGAEAAAEAASATAGSNGRESTVTPTGATSPADGAAEEAAAAADQAEPDTAKLAKLLEEWLNTEHSRSQPAQTTQTTTQQTAAPAPAQTFDQGQIPAAQLPTQARVPAQADVAVQVAQMAPVQPAVQPKATTQPLAGVANPNPVPNQQTDKPATTSETNPVIETPAAAVTPVMPQSGGQEQAASHNDGQQPAPTADSSGQAPAVTPAPTLAPTFASALELSRAAASQPPVRPALEQAVVDQIVQNAVIALRNNTQEFRIQLKPDFLGAMEVRVSMDNGVVAVRMSVESVATRQLIDNNISQLRQAFGADQVRVEHVPSFASSDAPWTFGQGAHQGFWQGQDGYPGSGRWAEAIPFNDEPEPTPAGVAQDAPPDGGIDLQA